MGDYYETFEPPYFPESSASRQKPTASKSGYCRSDAEITADLRDRLAHLPVLDTMHVEITASDRVITLKGTTRSRQMSDYLCRVAGNIAGVLGVKTSLRFTFDVSDRETTFSSWWQDRQRRPTDP